MQPPRRSRGHRYGNGCETTWSSKTARGSASQLVRQIISDELTRIVAETGDPHGLYERAREIFEDLTLRENFVEFLTVQSMPYLDEVAGD